MAENIIDRIKKGKVPAVELAKDITGFTAGNIADLPQAIAGVLYPPASAAQKFFTGVPLPPLNTPESGVANAATPPNMAGKRIPITENPLEGESQAEYLAGRKKSPSIADIPVYTNISPTGEAGEAIYKNGKAWMPNTITGEPAPQNRQAMERFFKGGDTYIPGGTTPIPEGAVVMKDGKTLEEIRADRAAVPQMRIDRNLPIASVPFESIDRNLPLAFTQEGPPETIAGALSRKPASPQYIHAFKEETQPLSIGEWFSARMKEKEEAAQERAGIKRIREEAELMKLAAETNRMEGETARQKEMTPYEIKKMEKEAAPITDKYSLEQKAMGIAAKAATDPITGEFDNERYSQIYQAALREAKGEKPIPITKILNGKTYQRIGKDNWVEIR